MSLVFPGDALGAADSYHCGHGTAVVESQVISTLAGVRVNVPSKDDDKETVFVLHSDGSEGSNVIPEINSLVIARIIKISPTMVNCLILLCNGKPLTSPYSAIIRRENVLPSMYSHVRIEECFRPGDLIQASVVSLGDSRSFYLSTLDVHLGVVRALSATSGKPLIPVSWNSMKDPDTGAIEKRKVAKMIAE